MKRTFTGVPALLCLFLLPAYSHGMATIPLNIFYSPADSVAAAAGESLKGVSDHALQILNNRYALLNKLVGQQTEKMLRRMEKKELALQQELQSKDSVKARALFNQTQAQYQQLLAKVQAGASTQPGAQGGQLKQYIPGVDSMQTALRFLSQAGGAGASGVSGAGSVSGISSIAGSVPGIAKVQAASQQLQQLQGTLQNANEAQAFIRQREQQLKEQLMNSGVARQLLGINKGAYYYQAQLTQYKDMLNSPDKIQQAVLSAVRQAPAFQRFWQKNSYWSRLFPAPAPAVAGTPQELAGLQTRDQVQQEAQKRLGISASSTTSAAAEKSGSGGGGGGLSYLQQKMQTMESQLNAIKTRLAQVGTGSTSGLGSSNMTMPDFQPNSQHTKTFLKRLQFSLVVQNSPSSGLLPAISSLGINIGYKLSDKATVGVGGSYLLGLGYGLRDIRLSNQGVGVRSFVDIKAKGSIWITGGFEYNYMQQFEGIQDIPHLSMWQKSALIGVTKTYRIGKKENNLQLLYDLLADSEVPRGQSFQFRMGWGF